jgi:zinc/manganese transport system permease protein
MLNEFFLSPFHYEFMQNALISCFCLSLGCGPVGVFLVLRRMSLMGDALSHAVLPGAAIGYMIAGLSLPALSLGGFMAGLLVALLAGIVSRTTLLKEDASFAGFFLIALALGVFIISMRKSSIDLMNILFGSALAVNHQTLMLMGTITTITLSTLALIYRALVVECFDPHFFGRMQGHGTFYHILFLMLVVLNLVSGFQSMGTLLSLGMMMLPATAAQFWSQRIWSMGGISILIGLISGYVGLLISYHMNYPTGPSIVLVAGGIYIVSLLFGKEGSVRQHLISRVTS